MKQITLILSDDYDDIVSVTAIGHSDKSTGMSANVLTAACVVIDGDTLYFPKETQSQFIRQYGERKELDNDTKTL